MFQRRGTYLKIADLLFAQRLAEMRKPNVGLKFLSDEDIPDEYWVYKQSYKKAQLYGFNDRGSLEIGKRADINAIDFGALEVHPDLPASETVYCNRRMVI